MRDLRLRLRALLFPRQAERELDEELAFHLEQERRKQLAAGLNPSEARRRAHARFGSLASARDYCRDVRVFGRLERLAQDVRIAARSLGRAPMYALTVIVTIALGLGLSVAAFTFFNAYALRPDAVRDPGSLYDFTWTIRPQSLTGLRLADFERRQLFSWSEFQELQATNPAFAEVLGRRTEVATRLDGRDTVAQLVTGNYFSMLGVPAALGRTLQPFDMVDRGRELVLVLSYQAWHRLFDAAPDVVGREVVVGSHRCVVVGVAAEGFAGLDVIPPDFWAPLTLSGVIDIRGPDVFGPDDPDSFEVVGRLKPGMSEAAARSALFAWAQGLTNDRAEYERTQRVMLERRDQPLGSVEASQIALIVSPVLAGCVLILTLACANVASATLARTMARRREFETRLGLGAAPRAIAGHVLMEILLLSVPAAIGAVAITQASLNLIVRWLIAKLPPEGVSRLRVHELDADGRVLAFALGLAVIVAVCAGLAPARYASRADRIEHVARKPWRLRQAVVALQVAASAALIVCTGVLLRGAVQAGQFEPGFDARGIIVAELDTSSRGVKSAVAALPFVTEAAEASPGPPLLGSPLPIAARVDDDSPPTSMWSRNVTSPFFELLRIPLLSGRTFTDSEIRDDAPIAILSASAARALWPSQTAVGQSVRIDRSPRSLSDTRRNFDAVQVVGVVADVAETTLPFQNVRPVVYFPLPETQDERSLVLRATGDLQEARSRIGLAVDAIAPDALLWTGRLQSYVAINESFFSVVSSIAGLLGTVALLLTTSGIYGIVSYIVAQRTREIGIRMALGARAESVVAFVLRGTMTSAAIGLALGAGLALAVSQLLRTMFPIPFDAFDAVAYVGGILVVLFACLLAASAPTLRATRVDPAETLRHD